MGLVTVEHHVMNMAERAFHSLDPFPGHDELLQADASDMPTMKPLSSSRQKKNPSLLK